MSFCTVNRNAKGEITKVLNERGQESRLFNTIAKHPLIKDTEQAFEVYKNVLSKKFQEKFKGALDFSRGTQQDAEQAETAFFVSKYLTDKLGYPINIMTEGDLSKELEKRGYKSLLDVENPLRLKDRVYGFFDPRLNQIFLNKELLSSKSLVHEMYHFYEPVLKTQAENGDLTAKAVLDKMTELALASVGGEGNLRILYDSKTAEPVKSEVNLSTEDSTFENKSADTQGFFSDVVTGKSDKFKPNKSWTSILPLNKAQEAFKKIYDKFKGNFDEHIATSIPTFRETQIITGAALSEMYKDGGLMYDIGGSEGGLVKAITETTKGNIRSINLDPNPDMKKVHEETPVKGSEFIQEAFYEGFEDGGVVYSRHNPTEKADVVHESMVFQFITPQRTAFVKEVADNYLKEDGIFLTEEKLLPDSEQVWANNEAVKNTYKSQFYTQEQLATKSEEVLVGMKKNQTYQKDYIKALRDNFTYVEEYWDAGNFKGIIATNSKQKLDEFLDKVGGKIQSKYSSVEGVNFSTTPSVNINEEVLLTNLTSEISRIKSLPKESTEDGVTLNLDGTKYTQGGLVIPAESINLTTESLSEQAVVDFIKKNSDKIGADNVKIGIYKFGNQVKVSIDLNIVADPSLRQIALEFGKLAGQESLYDLDTNTNIKTGATGENPTTFTPEQFKEISQALSEGRVPNVFGALETSIVDEVKVTKIESTNPSFEDMIDFNIEGGVLEIGKVNNSPVYSILSLKVDENKRRQGIATKLLQKALDQTNGQLSGQASNEMSVTLNYKLGMRAVVDGKELTLKETEAERLSRSYGSIRMILPENKRGENYTPFGNKTPQPSQGDVFMMEQLSSEVYMPRENETYEQYKSRMIGEASAILLQDNSVDYFKKLAKDNGLNENQTKNFIDRIKEFIAEFSEWLVNKLGLTNTTPEEVANLTQVELFDRITTSMLRGDFLQTTQKAQDYFLREADRLPLTLAVFSRPEFVKMQGKMVNPITVQNALNQSGIKQVEKTIIKDIIDTQFQGQKKISYDELEAVVRANIIPLERIYTSTYAFYGMDNLGEGDYGIANTIILNAPVNHNKEGHFYGDFTSDNRGNVNYIAKQLNENTWVAVEEGYESRANSENIYQFVGTAGSKEVVDMWITKFNLTKGVIYDNKEYLVYQDAFDQTDNVIPVAGFDTEQQANNFIRENRDKYPYNLDYIGKEELGSKWNLEDINMGMFSHIRVWEKRNKNYENRGELASFNNKMYKKYGEEFRDKLNPEEKLTMRNLLRTIKNEENIFHVAELQSDFFQKYKALDILIKEKELSLAKTYTSKVYKEQEEAINKELNDVLEKMYDLGLNRGASSSEFRSFLHGRTPQIVRLMEVRDGVRNNRDYNELTSEITRLTNQSHELAMQRLALITRRENLGRELTPYRILQTPEFKEFVNNSLTIQEKQFIASQKEWEKRTLREAIKEAANNGANSLRLPTPYTLSVIEGYIKASNKGDKAPYTVLKGGNERLEPGDLIQYLGREYVVINTPGDNIEILDSEKSNVTQDAIKDIILDKSTEEFINKNKIDDSKYVYKGIVNESTDEVLFLEKVEKPEGYTITDDIFESDTLELKDYIEKNKEELENAFGKVEPGDFSIVRQTKVNMTIWNATKAINGAFDMIGYTPSLEDLKSYTNNFKELTLLKGQLYDTSYNWEVLGQPDTYTSVEKVEFDIETSLDRNSEGGEQYIVDENTGDLSPSRVQRTVAYKYLKLADLLKQERGEGNFTVVTDENGFDWYETSITAEDSVKPIEAFMIKPREESAESSVELSHKTKSGVTTPSYKEALSRSQEGEVIEIGLEVEGEFLPVITVNKNTNKNFPEGFVNNLIEAGIISETKTKSGNQYLLEIEGGNDLIKAFNTILFEDTAKAHLGSQGYTKDGFTIKVDENIGKKKVLSKDGEVMYLSQEEIDSMSYEELRNKLFNPEAIILARELEKFNQAYRDTKITLESSDIVETTEPELQIRLLNLLGKLGVTTMSISEYIKKYKHKNGVHPSAKALADIAEKVIAFEEGDTSALTEEVAHFIVEAMPSSDTANVLRNIHKTEEWAEFSEMYRKIYETEYSGEALEEAVRKEVLGKIVAKVLAGQVNPKTEIQANIFERVWEAILNFFRTVSNNKKEEHKAELNKYLAQIEDLMLAEDVTSILNLENLDNNKLRLYSVQSRTKDPINKLRLKASALISKLKDAENQLIKSGGGSRSNVKGLTKIQSDLEQAVETHSIVSLLAFIKDNVRVLKAAIKDSQDNNKTYILSSEENVMYQTLKTAGIKAVGEVKVLLEQIKSEEKTDKWDLILKEINATILEFKSLEANADLIDSDNINKLIDQIMVKHNIPESKREMLEAWIERAKSDTNLFHATFGQLLHAKDGMLNLAGSVLMDMHSNTQLNFFNATKNFQDKLKQLGVTEQDLKKFVDGNYIVSEYDFNKFDADVNEIFVSTYRQAILETLKDPEYKTKSPERYATLEELSKKTDEELLLLKNTFKLEPLTPKEQTYRKNLERPRLVPLIERRMKDSYYEEYDRRLEEAGVSEVTKQELSNLISDINDIRKKAFRVVSGRTILDFDSLSEADKTKLSNLYKKRKMFKSYTTESGKLKPGLGYKTVNASTAELELDPETNQPIVVVQDEKALTDESRIALDLNKLDNLTPRGNEAKAAKLFYDTLRKIDNEQGRDAAIKFLEANSFISFTQDFWNNLGAQEGIVDQLDRVVNSDPGNTILKVQAEVLKRNLKTTTFEMKNILKIYAKKNNPAEIDVELMSDTAKDSVKLLHKNMMEDINRIYALIKENSTEEELEALKPDSDAGISGISEVNQEYLNTLKALGILESENDTIGESQDKLDKELEFARDHMSSEDYTKVGNALYVLQTAALISQSQNLRLDSLVNKALDRLGITIEEVRDNKEKYLPLAQREIIRLKLTPYYKRFAPVDYNQFLNSLQEVSNLGDYLEYGDLGNVEIQPNFSFFDEQENEQLNPNYDNEFKGGYYQPKKSQYRNSKFEEMFGTITEQRDVNGEVTSRTASKNNNLYQAYLATLEYNEAGLNAMGIDEMHNKYLMPQIRKNTLQRFTSFFKGDLKSNIQNFVLDALSYTEDDMIMGDTMYGDNVKVIPKMYVNRVEDPQDVSTELFYSLTMRAKEGFLRESRVKYYGDLMSIHDKVLTRDMNGKDASASNTYKMLKSAIDYNLFGIKETVTYPIKTPFFTVDLTKIARLLLNFVKFRNLGLNIVIPLTSLITGKITRRMEIITGEFIDSRSQKLGAAEFRKIGWEGAKEIGVINTEAKINALGQFFRAFNLQDSFNNSNYGWLGRFFPKMGMMLHTGANYPLYAETMLGILHDYRVVDGKMMNRNDFLNLRTAQKVNKKDAMEEWVKFESKNLYSFLIHDKNNIRFNKDALAKELTNEQGLPYTEEELDSAIQDIYSESQKYVSMVNSLIDGQIPEEDRVLAQRHYLLSYFMTHRGWLSIATARRFKNRHLNLQTGIEEEGSYRSLWDYMGGVVGEMREDNMANFVKAFKKRWDKSDELQRRNLRRVAIEMGSLGTLMILGLMLRFVAEDDDNEDIFALQLANYLTYRTLNELSSVQFNIGSQYSDVIEAPFVGWTTVQNFTKVAEVFSGEEVKYGNYRGMTERGRYLTKMVPGMKQYFDLRNMNQTYDTYRFYNQSNFSLTPVNLLFWKNTIDSPDEEED